MDPRSTTLAALAVAALAVAFTLSVTTNAKKAPDDMLVFTVATEETDGLRRYLRSAKIYKHNVKVLGLDEEWKGGDVARYPGGGQKVRLLLNELKKYKDEEDRVVMFTDGYDVVLAGTPSQILEQFYETKARILFGAEASCWPDESLADKYPEVASGKRFLNSGGFIGYARAPDYMDVVTGKRRGVWNVPYVTGAMLMRRSVITGKEPRPTYVKNLLDPDMALCENLREKGVFMYVSNRLDFGHLVDPENFETTHVHDELFEIINNRWDWEKRYIHVNYSQSLAENATVLQPCPDVFWFPIVTDRYCEEMIEELENFGRWSDGSNSDDRLPGGYENVPTVDIHMRQIGFHDRWMNFPDTYVKPIQQMAFKGYTDTPPRASMNFVVRYKPDEQPSLRPHHDSSTYTINIALNRAGIDFEGGGCRFERYNCSVTATRKGWMMMHPGRLTHLHEGLKVTKGVRYIQISFIDP